MRSRSGGRENKGGLENERSEGVRGERGEGDWSRECSWASSPHVPPGPEELTNLNVISHTFPNLNVFSLVWFSCGYCTRAHTHAHTTLLQPQYLVHLQCFLFLDLPKSHAMPCGIFSLTILFLTWKWWAAAWIELQFSHLRFFCLFVFVPLQWELLLSVLFPPEIIYKGCQKNTYTF